MELSEKITEKNIIVGVEGEINLFNSPRVREKIQKLFGEHSKSVVIDLSKVPYIDSTAIGTLISLTIHLKKKEKMLKLCALGEDVKKILATTKTNRYFAIYRSLEDAEKA